MMTLISNHHFLLDSKPKIAWSENQEKSLSKDFPFTVDGTEDPQQYVERIYLQFLWLPETLMPLKLLVPALKRVKSASSSHDEVHPLHTSLGRLLLTTRSIADKYRDLPGLLDKMSGEGEAKLAEEEDTGIEEMMAWYTLSYEKGDPARSSDTQLEAEPTWMDTKWRAKLIQKMERREFLIQILFHFLLISLPGPRPSLADPPAAVPLTPELSHVKRRKMKRGKTMVPSPIPPSLKTEDHLERLMDKLSMWQLVGDLDPTGTPRPKKRDELDWMQLYCCSVVEPQFKSTLPELCSLLRSKVFPNSPFSDEEKDEKDISRSVKNETIHPPLDPDIRPHKRARTSSSLSSTHNLPKSSKPSKHLTIPCASSSTRHPSPALSTTSNSSHNREHRPLERSRSRSLSVTLAEEEHQKAVEAKERRRQRADSIGGLKKRFLTREVSMSRMFKPKAKPRASDAATAEKAAKAAVKTEPKDLIVTLVEATPEKPRVIKALSRSQSQAPLQPLPLLLPSKPSPELEKQTLKPQTDPSGLSDLSELSELSDREEDEDDPDNPDTREEIWYPSTSSSPDVLLLADKSYSVDEHSLSSDDGDDWHLTNTPTKSRTRP